MLGFLPEIAEKCAHLSYYEASSGNSLPKFHGQLIRPILGVKKNSFSKPEEGTDRFYRNVGKKFPLLDA